MSKFFQAHCRARELKQSIVDQRDLERQIDKFVALTQAFVRREYTISIDYMERQKLIDELGWLRQRAENLETVAKRATKSSLRPHERRDSQLLGLDGNRRGQARAMVRRMRKLIAHLDRVRSNVNLFKTQEKRTLIATQVARAGDNWYDHVAGKMKPPPGGDLLVVVAILGAIFAGIAQDFRKDEA